MEDTESRFMHFLQPIRDLTKNWEVDVASQLGEYLEEVRFRTLNAHIKLIGRHMLFLSPEAEHVFF
uniref:Condensin-2 complex subunit H2 n=1 Tax=Anolis carolinensis TaxID=28377 RepID=A0A803SY10_ANOCA